jgi:hypothetical protein
MQVNPFDEAELTLEFRRLYKEIGLQGMYQVLFEIMTSAKLCADVMNEEFKRENGTF